MSMLTKPYFHDEEAAFAKLESLLWPHGPECPHCGNKERIYALKGVRSKASKINPDGLVRHGLKKCGKCRKQFTVRIGTVFESQPHPAAQVVHGDASSLRQQEGHQQPPASPRSGHHL